MRLLENCCDDGYGRIVVIFIITFQIKFERLIGTDKQQDNK